MLKIVDIFGEVVFFFKRCASTCSPGDVPGRGPAEEPGPFHRLPAHQRPSVLSGPGPAAAQGHVGRHAQLPGRVPQHPAADPEPRPGVDPVL